MTSTKTEAHGEDAPETQPDPLSATDQAFESLWAAVEAQWQEDGVHTAFVTYCSQRDDLVKAAARYRSVESEPGRAEIAQRQLGKVGALALAQLAAMPQSEPTQRNGLLWFTLIVVVGALLGWLAAQIV
jgi:hypothetical protein